MSIIQTFSNIIRKYPHLIAVALILLIGISAGLYLYPKTAVDQKRNLDKVSVEVEEVRTGSLTRTITAVGTLIANQTIVLKPEISGVIARIYVDGGEMVNKDMPLFEIDDRLYKSEVKDCEAKLKFATLELKRAKQLASTNFGSTQKHDDAQGKYLIAEAACDAANAKLEKTIIRAPFQGVVGLHSLSIGAHIGPDREIATLVDINPIKVDFKIPAEYIRFISLGQKINVIVDGFGERKFLGLLAGIDSKVDPLAHSINIRALMANKENLFKPGMFARIQLVVGSKDNTVLIPENAIESSGDQEMVYKVIDGLAFQVPIITGIREGENVEILRGLQPDDHIVTVGQSKIRDGTPVRYELNGQSYEFDEAEFKKKQQEFEEQKKLEAAAAEAGPVASDIVDNAASPDEKSEPVNDSVNDKDKTVDEKSETPVPQN